MRKVFPQSKYNLIVMDPPWSLKKLTHRARPSQVGFDYPTMSVKEICSLPVQSIADKNCWLFLWTTQKYLPDAFSVIRAYGFNYLLTMSWEKTYGRSSGMPLYGFRWNVEFVLVCYVGAKPPLWPSRKLIPAAFSAKNIRHSQKPDLFYEMIEPLGEKRIDLFARKLRSGWEVWGDEV